MSVIPFVDLKAQYNSIKDEIATAIQRVLDNTSFIMGKEVQIFEEQFAEYVGAKHCIAVNSGTAAVQVAVQSSGVTCGDEIILPTNSFFATAEGVSTAGAKPVFVDCDATTYNIDVTKIEAAITEKTKAIMPVHLYGQSADLDPIFAIAEKHNLLVLEDAAQAHGSLYKGKKVGALGKAGGFSFYPGKNLGAYSEGGAIVTNDDDVARHARLLRDHGSIEKYKHEIVGYNFRLEGLQGAILQVKLKYLDKWNDMRRANALIYNELLADTDLILPTEFDYARHIYHLYVVQTDRRDELQKYLGDHDIQTGIHYPIPIHLQPAYESFGHKTGDFPEAERQAKRLLTLPMFPELTKEQIEITCDAIVKFF
jgi:dTDP-4-amino-4,6-dideoxygalactose transaminase